MNSISLALDPEGWPVQKPVEVLSDSTLGATREWKVISSPGVSNPAPGELLSYRFQLQPQSNTPEPANQGLQGYLLISDRCVGAGLELKSAGW